MDSKSFTVYESQDYSVRLEYDDHLAILHLPSVSKFNKTVLQKMQQKVIELLDFLSDLGYNGVWSGCPSSDEKTNRLLHLLGFNFIQNDNNIAVYNLGVA